MRATSSLALMALLGLVTLAAPAAAAPVMMSADWARDACAAWNDDPVLTTKLVDSGWVKNDKGRGYKVMQVYRTDCGDKPTAEMRVALKDGKASCIYGGAPQTANPDSGADYVMKAKTVRWVEMGKGEYGPMMEAMGNMGPFQSFLLLVGKVPADTAACPAR